MNRFLSIILILFSLTSAKKIYDDQDLSTPNTHTYNPATREATGGTAWAFSKLQMCCDSMSKGDSILLRGGLHQEGEMVYINPNKTGTAWTTGNFNTIMSYPGEWAVVDGQNAIVSKFGDWASALDLGYLSEYWVVQNLEIMGGVAADETPSKQYAAGLKTWGGHIVCRNLYIHGNRASTEINNPSGISMHRAVQCTVETCFFEKNGSFTNGINAAHLLIYFDASPLATATDGFNPAGTAANRMNVIRYNYFGDSAGFGYKDKEPQLFSGRNLDLENFFPYSDEYITYGNYIHNNVFVSTFNPALIVQDFSRFEYNIVNCGKPLVAGMGYPFYKISVKNNTIIKSGIQLYPSVARYMPVSCEKNVFAYVYNNLIDSTLHINAWTQELSLERLLAETDILFDSCVFRNNVTTRPTLNANDADGSKVICKGVYEAAPTNYTISAYGVVDPNFKHFLLTGTTSPFQATTGSGKYKASGSFVLNGDTIISTGGNTGGYVGATDPSSSNLWVDFTLNVATLGAGYSAFDTTEYLDTSGMCKIRTPVQVTDTSVAIVVIKKAGTTFPIQAVYYNKYGVELSIQTITDSVSYSGKTGSVVITSKIVE